MNDRRGQTHAGINGRWVVWGGFVKYLAVRGMRFTMQVVSEQTEVTTK